MNENDTPLLEGGNTNSDRLSKYLNVTKIYNHIAPVFDIFTNREMKGTASKTTPNISNSNFFEIDMGGVPA